MTHSEKEAVDLAITGARTSSELLFFGRVFARSIVANFAFTRIVSVRRFMKKLTPGPAVQPAFPLLPRAPERRLGQPPGVDAL
jgi:hypothetical protein